VLDFTTIYEICAYLTTKIVSLNPAHVIKYVSACDRSVVFSCFFHQ